MQKMTRYEHVKSKGMLTLMEKRFFKHYIYLLMIEKFQKIRKCSNTFFFRFIS